MDEIRERELVEQKLKEIPEEQQTTENKMQKLLLKTKSKIDLLDDCVAGKVVSSPLRSVKKSNQLIVRKNKARISFIATG